MRIVSLLPSATELLCAVGAADALIGRSAQCDWPPSILDRPVLRTDNDDSMLRALAPDLVLAPEGYGNSSGDAAYTTLEFNPESIFDVFDDCLRVGEAAGCAKEAEAVMVELRGRYWSAIDFVNPYIPGPEVLFLEWIDPLRVGGHWVPSLIEAAGAQPTLTAVSSPGRILTPDEITAAEPERIIVSPCGVDLDAIAAHLDTLYDQPWWNNVVAVDGTAMFHRPGPRLVDAFEWLVGWINDRPELIPDGFPVRLIAKDSSR